MKNEYIIVMNQFLNGGVENLFLTISKIRSSDIFYLIILNKNVNNEKIKSLPANVRIIDCLMESKYKRFIYFSKYIKKYLSNVNIIIDFHEVLQSEFFMLFNSKNRCCIHWFNSNPYMRLKKRKNDLYFKIYPFYKKTICICNSQKEILRKLFPKMESSRFYVSNNFVDKEVILEKSQKDIHLNFKYIVMISRIDFGAKDFKTVIKAYEKLPDELKKRYKMVFVGDGPDFDELKDLINLSSDKENFYLAGNQSNPYPYIKNAEMFIQSSFSEGFPLAILEAWIIGCPIILSDFLCSAQELSANEKSTLIFKIGDSNQLSEKIIAILNNDLLKKSLVFEGKKKFELYYNEGVNSLNMLFNSCVNC